MPEYCICPRCGSLEFYEVFGYAYVEWAVNELTGTLIRVHEDYGELVETRCSNCDNNNLIEFHTDTDTIKDILNTPDEERLELIKELKERGLVLIF